MGLNRWFELQLHPATMDFTELDRRLSEFPAMRLSTPQLLIAFPSGAIVRQAADGRLPVPSSPILRVVYNDQIAVQKEREAKKAEKKVEVATAPASAKDAPPATIGVVDCSGFDRLTGNYTPAKATSLAGGLWFCDEAGVGRLGDAGTALERGRSFDFAQADRQGGAPLGPGDVGVCQE
ncbi:MAG: hypothetical protein ABSF70_10080 [Terracidiphilus sp.]|jgi:hypothetical protein